MQQMRKIVTDEKSYHGTVEKMIKTIEAHADDLKNFVDINSGCSLDKLSLQDFYNYVKAMPYRRDPAGNEIIPRPAFIIEYAPKYGRDCKKQSILIGAWAKLNGVPYRLKVVSRNKKKRMHHIYPELQINKKWLTADATYNNMLLGAHYQNTREKNFYVKSKTSF